MVIFGGLEILAAGYVLNELGKDEDKAKQNAERRRRRHHHHHHQDDSDIRHRPQRPPQHSLAPPTVGPPRPNSAPPVQPLYQQPQPRPGPWQNPPHPQSQRPQQLPVQRPPNVQSWPQQPPARPPQFQSPPPPYTQQPPPPGPGHLQSQPTMHYDMKTGKWQAGMLPPEMPRANSMPVTGQIRPRSTSAQPPPSGLQRSQRAYSSGSWSSSESGSDSDDDDLAYGHLPGKKQSHGSHATGLAVPVSTLNRTPSHERERPAQLQQHPQYQQPQELHGQSRQVTKPVEHDWYADQNQRRRQQGGPFEMEQPIRYELP
jgi:hypothetical protein